ncbi:MAG: hypothetical protein MZU97_02320 [Bacillus subtilis]|nr:hypothetical protein [Bacillus subtilis]
MKQKSKAALDPANGYFAAKKSSMNNTISDMEKSITKGENRLEAYRKRLVSEFGAMDKIISQLNQQSSSLSRIL